MYEATPENTHYRSDQEIVHAAEESWVWNRPAYETFRSRLDCGTAPTAAKWNSNFLIGRVVRKNFKIKDNLKIKLFNHEGCQLPPLSHWKTGRWKSEFLKNRSTLERNCYPLSVPKLFGFFCSSHVRARASFLGFLSFCYPPSRLKSWNFMVAWSWLCD